MDDDRKIQLIHPQPGKQMPRISRRKYELVKDAILEIIPNANPGYPFKSLADGVAARLTPQEVAEVGAIGWYTTCVKLDLEARGVIERIPGVSPQRLRQNVTNPRPSMGVNHPERSNPMSEPLPAMPKEGWANTIVRLHALASSLESEGYYNIAKLARAAADSLCRRAAHADPIPAQAIRLVDELSGLGDTLAAFGVDASLIRALDIGRKTMAAGRLPMFDQTPDPYVCRSCGHLVVGQPGYRCAGCGAPGDTMQVFKPIYWLAALDPFSALQRLRQTPMDVADLVAARARKPSTAQAAENGWNINEALSHLLDAEKVLNLRIRRMLAEDDPSLEALAVMAWAGDNSRHPDNIEEILREYLHSREDTLGVLESIPLGDWWRTGSHAEFGPVTIGQQASYFAMHEITHLPQIAKAKQTRITD